MFVFKDLIKPVKTQRNRQDKSQATVSESEKRRALHLSENE